MGQVTPLHPLSLVVLGAARLFAEDPTVVDVAETRNGDLLTITVLPGCHANTGAIIGRRGAKITRIRALAEEMALTANLRVRVRVDATDRPPADRAR